MVIGKSLSGSAINHGYNNSGVGEVMTNEQKGLNKMTNEQQIQYLKDFIKKWESAEETFLENGLEYPLIEEFRIFCEENNLPHISADELLSELLNKKE
jgi:hypothetical protein